jgi:hypothetical protein
MRNEREPNIALAALRDLFHLLVPLVVDIGIFVVVWGGLYLALSGIRLLEHGGYSAERIAILETLHYYAVLTMFFVLAIDLLYKIVTMMFFRSRPRRSLRDES